LAIDVLVTMEDNQRVLILGTGFAGLYTVLHLGEELGRQPEAEITLIDWNHVHPSRLLRSLG
jgi:NADH dehydrogenase FAD-containing subunit